MAHISHCYVHMQLQLICNSCRACVRAATLAVFSLQAFQQQEAALQVQVAHLTLQNMELRRELGSGWNVAEPAVVQASIQHGTYRALNGHTFWQVSRSRSTAALAHLVLSVVANQWCSEAHRTHTGCVGGGLGLICVPALQQMGGAVVLTCRQCVVGAWCVATH